MPARLRSIRRALAKFGVDVEKPKRSGSHFHAKRDGVVFPLAAHNGDKSELSDVYIRKLCETYGIDYDEFKKHL